MVIVLSTDSEITAALVADLDPAGLPQLVATRSVGVALALIEDNDVTAVLVHEPSASTPFTRAIARRFPQLVCIRVTRPLDVHALRLRIQDIESSNGGDEPCVVAHGLDELLGLLAMTRHAARIEINAGLCYGTLAVRDGCIVHACMGQATGHEVALRLLGLHAPRIRSRRLVDEECSLRLSIAAAMHEAARRHDELHSLATGPQVAVLLDPLSAVAGSAGVLVADADNGTALLERGLPDEASTQRLWHAVSLCRADGGGVAWWDAHGSVVAAPVGVGRILAAGRHADTRFVEHRQQVVDTGHALGQLLEGIHGGAAARHASIGAATTKDR